MLGIIKFTQKFFANRLQLTKQPKYNPYLKYIEFNHFIETIDNSLKLLLVDFDIEKCRGHFINCPAIPTAFLIYNIIQYAGNYIAKKNNKKFYVNNVDLSLLALLFPDTKKEILIEYQSRSSSDYYIKTIVRQSDKDNSYINFNISLL